MGFSYGVVACDWPCLVVLVYAFVLFESVLDTWLRLTAFLGRSLGMRNAREAFGRGVVMMMGGFFALGPVMCLWALVGLCHEGVFSGNIAVDELPAAIGSLVSFLRSIIWFSFWRLLEASLRC